MKSKDQLLLEEAYNNVGQNEIARKQQEVEDQMSDRIKALDDNKDLKFEGEREFLRWSAKNLPGLWDHTDSDLHPELGPELMKAEQAGRWEEEYTNPYSEKTLWWWMAQLFNKPDKMP